MSLLASAAVLFAVGLDGLFAELPTRAHPVVWFGKLVAPFDREWARPRLVGVVVAAVLPLFAASVVAAAVTLAGDVAGALAVVLAALVLFSSTSLRMLLDTAFDVIRLATVDIDEARTELRALAGRDASALTPAQVQSAAVESLAENLADGLVGPLFAFALLAPASLSLAAAGATWVKAVNTLDSMLGYRSKPVGWASARLDDAVMWLPARLSAAFVAVAADVAHAPQILARARESARIPASPNSGWPMATLAVALDVRLEKPGHYRLNPGRPLPTDAEAMRGVRVVGRAALVAVVVACVVAASDELLAVTAAALPAVGHGLAVLSVVVA